MRLAEYWGRHPYTIHRWIRHGWLKATLLGCEYQIAVADALEFEARDPEWRKHEAS